MSTTIHQEVTFNATPERIYELLLDEAKHGAFTGAPASISRDVGGRFSCFGGQIEGRNIELVAGKRIVQAWRAANWQPGEYSLVRVELQSDAKGTRLVLDHTGVREDQHPHLDNGWHQRYWEPLSKYLTN